MAFYLLLSMSLIAADQIIKRWAVRVLMPAGRIPLIDGVFSLQYLQNYGAAWGIFQGKRALLLILTGIVLAAVFAAFVTHKFKGRMLCFSVSLILAGGLGNLIDRIAQGYVVDYLYFELIDFPIFNFADCCIVAGTILLAVYVLFFESREKKEEPHAGGNGYH